MARHAFPPAARTALAIAAIAAAAATPLARPLTAQNRTGAGTAASPRIPTDPALRAGVLPNGVHYLIRHNATPTGRANVWLVVNAGSVLEDDDQRGLAHFVEHMAFNGTKRFPRRRLIDYLELIGMKFGADLNAYTSFEETVYQLTVPTEPAVLDTAVLIAADWAHGVTFDSAAIEDERGVVLEERRMRGGTATEKNFGRHAATLFRGTRYGQRLPIGKPEILRHAPRAALVRFYHDWYRPDLMTVIAVGDFDVEAMRARIAAQFGGIPRRPSPRSRDPIRVQLRDTAVVSVAADNDVSTWSAQLEFPKSRPDSVPTEASVRRGLTEQLFYAVLNDRFGVLARADHSPILGAQAGPSTLGRYVPVHEIGLNTEAATLELGIYAVRAELARLARDGVTAAELERARTAMMEQVTAAELGARHILSSTLTNQYVQSVLTGEPIVDPRAEAAAEHRLLAELTAADVQRFAAEVDATPAPMVLATVPKNGDMGAPDARILLDAFKNGDERKLGAYQDSALVAPLVASPPTPGRIVRERTVAALGVTEWTLSNGARVLLKPTPNDPGQIMVRAVSAGGTSLASDGDYVNASVASALVGAGGLGPYDRIALAKRIAGLAQWGVQITPDGEAATVGGSPRHARTLLELLHLAFTAPRADTAEFAKWRRNARRGAPDAMEFATRRALTRRHPRARPADVGPIVDSIDVNAALAFYRARFADAGHFTFVVVGDFVPDSLRAAVEQYVGGLPGHPAEGAPPRARDLGIRAPDSAVRRTVVGADSASTTRLVYDVPMPYTQTLSAEVEALGAVLTRRLMLRLREDMSGTYGVGASGRATEVPYAHARLQIQFMSAPERVAEMQRAMFAVIDTLRTGGVTDEEVRYVSAQLRRKRETEAQDNGYWTTLLQQSVTEGRTLDDVAAHEHAVATVTAAAINAAAARLLDPKHYVLVTSLPVRMAPADRDELLSTRW